MRGALEAARRGARRFGLAPLSRAEREARERAAVVLQRWWARKLRWRRLVRRRRQARQQRRRYTGMVQRRAAAVLQRWWRHQLSLLESRWAMATRGARRELRDELDRRDAAARVLQRFWAAWRWVDAFQGAHAVWLAEYRAAVAVQRLVRAHQARARVFAAREEARQRAEEGAMSKDAIFIVRRCVGGGVGWWGWWEWWEWWEWGDRMSWPAPIRSLTRCPPSPPTPTPAMSVTT